MLPRVDDPDVWHAEVQIVVERILSVADAFANEYTYPNLGYTTRHRLDLAATLPLAGAFRELMQADPKTGKQNWIVDSKEAFKRTADELYKALTTNPATSEHCIQVGV
jgi:hypothetical protein